jgi:hypothetical protein
MTPLGQAARRLGARGLRVFPCWPRKKEPAIKDNLRLARVDETIIAKWWGAQGQYNVAIATGIGSRIWVLDVDADDGGEATLRALEAKYGALPPTVEAVTANGRHLYWRWPDNGVEIRNWQIRDDLPGLDGRGEGGYVPAPPSVHPDGPVYAWSVDSASEIAFAPEWLIKIAVERSSKSGNGQAVAPTLPGDWQALMHTDHYGSRRAGAVAKVFGHLIRKFVDPAIALALVEMFASRSPFRFVAAAGRTGLPPPSPDPPPDFAALEIERLARMVQPTRL